MLTISLGLIQINFDYCVFFIVGLVVLVYVDEMLKLCCREDILSFQTAIGEHLLVTMSDINYELNFFGLHFSRDSTGNVVLSQVDYLQRILDKKEKYIG